MWTFEINGIHGNTSLCRSVRTITTTSSLCFWLTCQMWTELGQKATTAALWLALHPAVLHSSTVSPLDVIITQSNPLLPRWGPLRLLSFLFTYFRSAFTRSISVWFTLTLSPSIFLCSVTGPSLSISVTKMRTSGASACLLTQESRGTQLSSWMV